MALKVPSVSDLVNPSFPDLSPVSSPLLGVSPRAMTGKGPAAWWIKCLATGQRIGSAVVTGQCVQREARLGP